MFSVALFTALYSALVLFFYGIPEQSQVPQVPADSDELDTLLDLVPFADMPYEVVLEDLAEVSPPVPTLLETEQVTDAEDLTSEVVTAKGNLAKDKGYTGMKKAELVALCLERGLGVSKKATKRDLIDLLSGYELLTV